MLVMAMMLATAGPDAPIPWGDIRFSRSPSLAHTSETVDITARSSGPGRSPLVVMRLTRRRLGKVVAVLDAEDGACPAVRETIVSIHHLPIPSVVTPGDDGDIVLDGINYAFEGSTRSPGTGHVAFWVTDGPFARWVDERLAALAPCWRPAKS